jgi:hypothetical protein
MQFKRALPSAIANFRPTVQCRIVVAHQTLKLFTPNILYLPIPLWNRAIFAPLKALGRGLQMFFQLQKQRNNVSEFDFL